MTKAKNIELVKDTKEEKKEENKVSIELNLDDIADITIKSSKPLSLLEFTNVLNILDLHFYSDVIGNAKKENKDEKINLEMLKRVREESFGKIMSSIFHGKYDEVFPYEELDDKEIEK